MNCYVHREIPAVGICKSCGKAVCPECVAAEAPAIACATGRCAERVAQVERLLDLNVKLMPRTEKMAAAAESISRRVARFTGAGDKAQTSLAGLGKTIYVFNLAIGLGCVAGGAIVVRDGILWKFYALCLVGGLLALIGIALLVAGARAARTAKLFRADQSEESSKPSSTDSS